MFQQLSEKEFNTLFRLYPYGGSIGYALRELLLYRDLGTLQQLSYATDAVAERDKYAATLDQIGSAPHAPDAYLVARAAREKP